MNARNPPDSGWFVDGLDREQAVKRVRTGTAATPQDWPALAVEAEVVSETDDYYQQLHEITRAAAREAVTEHESADDQQLIHLVRALDDCQRTANELTERVGEWAGSYDADASMEPAYFEELAAREPDGLIERRLVSLAKRVVELKAEANDLEVALERATPEVAPNLSKLAGPLLAARLIALAGGLDSLAKKPSGTLQVLGAEDALFAHLKGNASPPKHGIIYTHEAIRGTPSGDRGSAARALAGKLTIAARVDYYSGELRPELAAELADRIERIRARGSQ